MVFGGHCFIPILTAVLALAATFGGRDAGQPGRRGQPAAADRRGSRGRAAVPTRSATTPPARAGSATLGSVPTSRPRWPASSSCAPPGGPTARSRPRSTPRGTGRAGPRPGRPWSCAGGAAGDGRGVSYQFPLMPRAVIDSSTHPLDIRVADLQQCHLQRDKLQRREPFEKLPG